MIKKIKQPDNSTKYYYQESNEEITDDAIIQQIKDIDSQRIAGIDVTSDNGSYNLKQGNY